MAAAANFAFANRQVMSHWARETFAQIFHGGPRDCGLEVVYDVCHNIAKFETFERRGRKQRVCVHRKGATRAYPPGHPAGPGALPRVGQPVIIPGDMGRYSFVLAGSAGAYEQTFGSTCHGAGRRLSRQQAKRAARGRPLLEELEARGVIVRAAGMATVAEEIPEAYKDVAEVVDVVERRRPVAPGGAAAAGRGDQGMTATARRARAAAGGEARIGLNAVIVAVTDESPRILTLPAEVADGPDALPFGPLDPDGDRTLERGLRGWVRERAGLELGYVEQLYTFGDRFREPGETSGGPRLISVAYLALVREARPSGGATWRGCYEFLPWEDWRGGRPPSIEEEIVPALASWAKAAEDRATRRARQERVEIAFGLGGAPWDGERVLDRYELLYEVGLVARGLARPAEERHRAARAGRRTAAAAPPGAAHGARPPPDPRHRPGPAARQAALPAGGLRAAAAHLHPAPAAAHRRGAGRRAPAQAELPPRGRDRRPGRGHRPREVHTGGRPAELFRFRREVLRERPAPGVGLPGRRP